MTDQNPGPTTRMPVPEPAATPIEGAPQSAAPPPAPSVVPAPAVTPAPSGAPAPPVAPRPRREDSDHGRTASILFGLVILGLGLWFFAERTLGIELPRIRWSQIWPITLIVIGLWVVLGSMRRGSR